MKTKIGDILKAKGSNVFSVDPEATIFDAITLMAAKKIGAVLVVKDEKPAGIFTERDYLSKIILQGFSSKETLVKNTMTVKVAYVHPENTVEEGLAVMTEKRCRHLPVCNKQDGKLAGLISIGDLVKQVIKDQKATINYLKEFVSINY